MEEKISPNLGLDLARVTEAAALTAGRWMGFGMSEQADQQAAYAMAEAFNTLNITGSVIIGEEGKLGTHTYLDSGSKVGSGEGPCVDVVADPIDGTISLAKGHPGAISVAGLAPCGSMWDPCPAIYMEKIIVDEEAAEALVPECMDAPAAWTLALIARVKKKKIRDLVVFVLDRPRHQDLIEEIRTAGARIMLRSHGDVAGALMTASSEVNVDILMGIGGISEGVIAACAIKSLGGAMLGRLAPQTPQEHAEVEAAGLDMKRILTCSELVTGDDIYFAATGITSGVLLKGIRYHGNMAETETLVIRNKTGTKRIIHAEHLLSDD